MFIFQMRTTLFYCKLLENIISSKSGRPVYRLLGFFAFVHRNRNNIAYFILFSIQNIYNIVRRAIR